MNVFVTGVTGFLGAALARTLLAQGHRVTGLARDPARAERVRAWCGADDVRLAFVFDDLCGLTSLPAGTDTIVHAAALRDPACTQYPAEGGRVNVQGTCRVLRLAARQGSRRFVFLSSQSVYGAQPIPWREEQGLAPKTTYAFTKLCGEVLVGEFADSLDWSVLRLARLYGVTPFTRWDELLGKFARLVVLGEPLPVHGDGSQRFDLVHVADAAACVGALLEGDARVWNTVYNVGSGGSVPLNALVEGLGQAAERLALPPVRITHQPQPASAPQRFELDTARAQNQLGWCPARSLQEALEAYLRAAESEGG